MLICYTWPIRQKNFPGRTLRLALEQVGKRFLNQAADKGWDKAKHTSTDNDLFDLHTDERWNGLIAKVQTNWDNGKDDRKKDALAEKVSEPAPLWELEDVNDEIVKLADLKGNIIILDFWATWCGPCRMAMPVLDEFVKNRAAENVKVYSINV